MDGFVRKKRGHILRILVRKFCQRIFASYSFGGGMKTYMPIIKYFKIPLEDKYDILPNYKLFIFIVNSGSKHFANEYFRCILEQAFFLLLYF